MIKKLKLISIDKTSNCINKLEEISIKDYSDMVELIKRLFKGRDLPRLEIGKFINDYCIVNIQYEEEEELIIDKYIISGVMLNKDRKLIIKLLDKYNRKLYFTNEEFLNEYISK